MLDSSTGMQYNLTEMEYDILKLISNGKNIKEINNDIIENYDVDTDESMEDLMDYIKSLCKENIITVNQ